MTGLVVAVLLSAACLASVLPRKAGTGSGSRPPGRSPSDPREGMRPKTQPDDGGSSLRRLLAGSASGRGRAVDLHELPLFVHQLSGLLRAGRPPHMLWTDLESVYADGDTPFCRTALPVLAMARRAAALGLSVPGTLRQAAAQDNGSRVEGASEVHRLWVDLAGCLDVAERSGAPLSGILEHYASQLDAQLDAVSARETALAGPRATVVLLAWLPVVGLFLGFALGVDPLQILTASPLGQLALGAGALLMVAARVWSSRLVLRASGRF
jgi:tight adherence protein B